MDYLIDYSSPRLSNKRHVPDSNQKKDDIKRGKISRTVAKNFAPHFVKDGRYTSGIWFYLRWTRTGHRYGIVIPKVAPVSLSNTYVGLLLHDIFFWAFVFDIDRFLVGQKEP